MVGFMHINSYQCYIDFFQYDSTERRDLQKGIADKNGNWRSVMSTEVALD